MLIQLLSKIFVGGVVGYTTNDMAIQMLFRKRLGLGGIFLKTTEEFILNISKVVEKDVLNHKTLYEELNTPAFQEEVEKTVRRYLEQQLFESVPDNLTLGDVPGLDTAFSNLLASLNNSLPEAVNPLIGQLVSNLTVGDLASTPQLEHLSKKVTSLLLQKLEEFNVIERFVRQFYQEVAKKTPTDLLTEGFIEEVSLHGAYVSEVLHQTLLRNYTDELDSLIQNIYRELDISELVGGIAEEISKMSFNDIFGEETMHATAEQLLEEVRRIVASEQGEQMLAEFANLLIDTLEQEEKTVFDLLNPDIQKNIRLFFKEHFPPILERVIVWLYSKQPDIEILIDEAFGRNMDSKFKGWLIETFVGSVSKSSNVIEKLVEIIKSYSDNPERIARQLTQQIITFLNEQSVGSIVQSLRKQNTLLKFSGILQKNIGEALNRLEVKDFQALFSKSLSNFFELEQVTKLVDQNIQLLIQTQLKDRFLYSRRASLLLSSTLQNRLWLAGETPIGKIITPNNIQDWSEQLEEFALRAGGQYQGTIEQLLLQNVAMPLVDRNWSSIVTAEQLSGMSGFAIQNLEGYLRNGFEKRKQNRLHTYFRVVNRIPDLHENISDVLRLALLENLETILDGRIESLVQSNLRRQSTAQIRDMVEKFMGMELKPITRLGALFGGIAGGVLAYLPTFQGAGLRWGVPALAYGLTGLGTNWIALRMIFRPYTKKYLPVAKVPVPLTPGVVVRRQTRFANKMGAFVSDKLMNADGLKDSFDDKKSGILDFLIDLLRKDDYERLETFVQSHKEELGTKVADTAYRFLIENTDKIKKQLKKLLSNYQSGSLESIDTTFLEEQILNYLRRDETVTLLQAELQGRWQDLKENTKTLDTLIPEKTRANLVQVIRNALSGEAKNFTKQLTQDEFIDTILNELNRQAARYGRVSLDLLLQGDQQARVQKQFADYLYKELGKEELKTGLMNIVLQRVEKEISPDKTIGQLFGGGLLDLVTKNLDFIIQKIFETGVIWMKNNGEVLADRIYERAFAEQRAALFYKDAIRKTVIDLTNNGIPGFVERERGSIHDLIDKEIQRLGNFPIESLNVSFDKPDIRAVIDNVVAHPKTEESVERLTVALLRETFQLPLGQLLPLNEFGELTDLQTLLREQIKKAGGELEQRFRRKEVILLDEAEDMIGRLLADVLAQISTRDLLKDFSDEKLNITLQNSLKTILESEAFTVQVRLLVQKLVGFAKSQPLEELLEWEQLQHDLDNLIDKITSNADYEHRFKQMLKAVVTQNMGSLNKNIPKETKEFLVKTLAESAIDALGHRLPDILGSVNIHDIVVKELNNMSPQDLEQLFKGFAKKYLDELVRYGFGFGVVFGMGLDVILMALLGLVEE